YVLNIYFCVSFSFWFIYLAFFLRSAADGDLHPFLHDALPISLSLAAHQLLAGPQIVTGMIARIKIIEAVQKLVNIASALHRRYPASPVAKAHHGHRVTLTQSHKRQHEAGIQGLVEMTQLTILSTHPAPTIQHEHHLLIAFVLKLPGNQLQTSGGCFPVNLADGVIRTILPELMELPALTPAGPLTNSQLGNMIVLCQQAKTSHCGKVGIHP